MRLACIKRKIEPQVLQGRPGKQALLYTNPHIGIGFFQQAHWKRTVRKDFAGTVYINLFVRDIFSAEQFPQIQSAGSQGGVKVGFTASWFYQNKALNLVRAGKPGGCSQSGRF